MALLSYFKLNGNFNNELPTGNATYISGDFVSGIEGQGIKFDGLQKSFEIPSSALSSTTGSLSISFWVKIEITGFASHLIRKDIDASDAYNINVHIPWYPNKYIYWDIGNNTASYNRIEKVLEDKFIADGRWHHIVFQLNSSTATQEVYLDAKLWHSGTPKTLPFVNSSKPLVFGDRQTGCVDEIKIFDNALTSAEIESLYYQYRSDLEFKLSTDIYNVFSDLSEKTNSVVNYNVESGHGVVSKYSAYFNGNTNKYLRCQLDYVPSGNFTWCAWVMKNRHSIVNYPIFMSFGLPYIASDSSTLPFRFSYRNSSNAQVSIVGTTVPSLDQWYHVCVTQDNSDLKLFVNGVQEATTTILANPFEGSLFDIGRHFSDDNYRIWGRVDDARFYRKALTQQEIDIIRNRSESKVLEFKNNGDIYIKKIDEDVEWELLNNWICPELDGTTNQFDTSIGSRVLSSVASMQADGWTTYLTSVDNTSYSRIKGYSQHFYSGEPIGYIQKTLPSGYDMIRIKWGNWYTGTSQIFLDGVSIQILVANEGAEFLTFEYSGTPVLRISESGIYWIAEIWVGKKKTKTLDLNHSGVDIPKIKFNEKSINLHSYSVWQPGTGSSGSFIVNGSASESSRKYGADPWGRKTVIWESFPDSVSGRDGGWNYEQIPIDNTKMYRYSVWVRRNGTNNGTF